MTAHVLEETATSIGYHWQIGPDVYSGNGSVDWPAARYSGGTSFAILKACEGTTPDSEYSSYQIACQGLFIPTGPYLFMRFGGGASSPQDQADALLALAGDQTDFVPAIDVEFPGGRSKYGISAQQALDAIRACVARIQDQIGASPMIYTSAVIWADPDGLDALSAPDLGASCPLWVKWWPYAMNSPAVYDSARVAAIGRPPLPTPWPSFLIHQYQGDAVQYPGFTTPCDLNRLPVLAVGAQGPEVAWVQARVGTGVDGDFGTQTQKAVEAFQTAQGLAVDGVVGAKTTAALTWISPGV